jgi:hypothetical protein
MKQTLAYLLDASLPAAIGGFLNSYGYPRTAMLMVGVSIGLAIAIVWRALVKHLQTGRLIEVDEEAGIALCEFSHNGRTSRRWLPIGEVIGAEVR